MMSLVMVTASKHGYLHTPTDTPHLLQLQLPMQCRACSSLAVVMATTHKNAYLHTPTDTPHLLQLQLHHAVPCLLFAGCGDGIRQQTHTHTYTLLQKHPTCCSCSCTMQCCACSSLAVVMATASWRSKTSIWITSAPASVHRFVTT